MRRAAEDTRYHFRRQAINTMVFGTRALGGDVLGIKPDGGTGHWAARGVNDSTPDQCGPDQTDEIGFRESFARTQLPVQMDVCVTPGLGVDAKVRSGCGFEGRNTSAILQQDLLFDQ